VWGTNLGSVLPGGRRLLLARPLPPLLHVHVPPGPPAVLLHPRAAGLLQSRLQQVSIEKKTIEKYLKYWKTIIR